MDKERAARRLENAHLKIINKLEQVQYPNNWRTSPDKTKASLILIVEEAIILAKIARLKRSYPHMRGALECLYETRGFAEPELVQDISKQAAIASLTYPKYQEDGTPDKNSDIGKFDTSFNRLATFLQSVGQIVRIRLGI